MNSAFAPVPSSRIAASRAAPERAAHELSLASDLSELTKARLTVMVLLTTLAGYCLASRGASTG